MASPFYVIVAPKAATLGQYLPSETNCQLQDPTLTTSLTNSLLDKNLLIFNTPTSIELHPPMLVI